KNNEIRDINPLPRVLQKNLFVVTRCLVGLGPFFGFVVPTTPPPPRRFPPDRAAEKLVGPETTHHTAQSPPGAACVQQTEDEVTRNRSLNGCSRRVLVANLTHHHDVRVET